MLGIEWFFKRYLMTVTKQMQINIICCFFIVFHEFSNVSPHVLVTNDHDHDDLWRPWYHDDNLNHDDLGDHDDPGDHDTMMTISAHDDHINHDEHLDHEDHLDYDEHLDHDDHHNWRLYTCKCQQNDKNLTDHRIHNTMLQNISNEPLPA